MVPTGRDARLPIRRAPHFDSTGPFYLAVLHYGCEQCRFIVDAQCDASGWAGYIGASNAAFEGSAW